MERTSKVKSLAEALAVIEDGMSVCMPGTHYNSVPMGAVRQIIRQGSRHLTLMPTPSAGFAADMLIAAGCLEAVYCSFLGLEFMGLASNFRRAAEQKTITIHESDEAGLVMGYKAGAAGIPYMPMPKFYRLNDLPKVSPDMFKETTDPFSGEICYAVPALRPDVAVIHVQLCDPFGNARQVGGNHMESVIAKAADHVIITTEAIQPVERTKADPVLTTIPGFIVDSVVELPYGAHPASCPARYNYDRPHLGDYARLAKEGRTAEYIDKYVFGPADHGAYLDAIGAARLMALRTEY